MWFVAVTTAIAIEFKLDTDDVEAGEQVTAMCDVTNPSNNEFMLYFSKKSVSDEDFTGKLRVSDEDFTGKLRATNNRQ